MAHSYTKKDGKLCCYYRCSRAEKQSRSACEMPPVSAGEIESQMVAEIRRFAADPALVDKVFAEVTAQQSEQGEGLETERTRLLRERKPRQEAIKRLVDAVGSGENGSGALLKRSAGELEASNAQIEDRLAAVDSDRLLLRHQRVEREPLERTLRQFTDLWDALYPGERCRLVRSLVSRVVYDDLTDSLQIEFKAPEQEGPSPGSSKPPDQRPLQRSSNPRVVLLLVERVAYSGDSCCIQGVFHALHL